jgi:hypothetical protein
MQCTTTEEPEGEKNFRNMTLAPAGYSVSTSRSLAEIGHDEKEVQSSNHKHRLGDMPMANVITRRVVIW